MPLPAAEVEALENAMRDFVRTLMSTPNIFKVGRCRESEIPTLKSRPEYSTAIAPPRVLWKGSRAWVAGIESVFILAGWETFGARSFNENDGGGAVSDEPVHAVYLVEWLPTDERRMRALFLKLCREAPPEPKELKEAFAQALAEAEKKGFKF